MVENQTLEKSQRTNFDNLLGTYTVIAEGVGATCEERPKLSVHQNGIHLHFLRHGLFDAKSGEYTESDNSALSSIPNPEVTTWSNGGAVRITQDGTRLEIPLRTDEKLNTHQPVVELDQVTVVDLKGLPKNNNFSVGHTTLRPGYLYFFDYADPANIFLEYEVLPTGHLKGILWGNNKDQHGRYKDERKSSGRKLTHHTVKKDSRWWVCYSAVQWDIAYHKKVATDDAYRSERMKLVHCTGFARTGETIDQSGVMPFYEVAAVFPKESTSCNVYYETIADIAFTERLQEARSGGGENDLFEDMFVCLHDPIGCALDMAEAVSTNTLKFMAVVDAIQSGERVTAAFKRLSRGELEAPKPEKEYGELFTLALTCYQMVYNNSATILKYDGGAAGFNFNDRHSLDPRPLESVRYGKGGMKITTRNDEFIRVYVS